MDSEEESVAKDEDPEFTPKVTSVKDGVKKVRPSQMMKQTSLPEGNEVVNSWNTNLFTNHVSPFLSPQHASSNTLTGSMYTASEGLHTPASGTTQDAFRTPIGGSLTSFRRSQSSGLDYRFFSSCHSRLGFMLEREDEEDISEEIEDHARENALNEEKLKDMEQNKCIKSKNSLKDKILRGIQTHKANLNTGGGKDQGVQIVVKTDGRASSGSSTKVVHGILKSSVSSDSGSMGARKPKTQQSTTWGGTKALLIEKVSVLCITYKSCELFAEMYFKKPIYAC